MNAEAVMPWVFVAILLLIIWWGRKGAQRKANRLRAEGGRAALQAHISQTVNVGSTVNSEPVYGSSDESAVLAASYDRVRDRGLYSVGSDDGRSIGRAGPVVARVPLRRGVVHARRTEVTLDSDEALQVLADEEVRRRRVNHFVDPVSGGDFELDGRPVRAWETSWDDQEEPF